MILKETSILKRLPLVEEKQLLILDSLRFTIQMIDYNYQRMENKILKISHDKIVEHIYLETVDKKKKPEIDLSKLYLDFTNVVKKFRKWIRV